MIAARRVWRTVGVPLAIAGGMTVCLASKSPQDQNQPLSEPPHSASTRSVADPPPLVRVEAVVTDRQGRPILDLDARDFELTDNGVAQKLSGVELRRAASDGASIEPPPILTQADEERVARDPATRIFAVFLDEFHVDAGAASERVRAALTTFVTEDVRPADLVLILKPLEPLTTMRFTRDRAVILAAIGSFQGRKGEYAPRTPFEEQYFGRAPAAAEAGRVQVVTTALREIVMRIGDLEARRAALVLVSEGFDRPANRGRRIPDIETLVRASSHFGLAAYTFNPADPARTSSSSDANDALRALAFQTGGESSDAATLAAGLRRMARDLDVRYELTYRPSAPSDGTFHAVTVQARRRDAQVRARAGYWSPLSRASGASISLIAAPVAPTRALRRSPLIESWSGVTRSRDGQMRLTFTWEPAHLIAAPRRAAPPFVVRLKASMPSGGALFEGEVSPVRGGEATDTRDRAIFDVPAGRVQLDLKIVAADGTVLDTGAQDIDVSAPRGSAPVILPLQIVRAGSAREFREISTDPEPAPSPARAFSRTERLMIRVPAYDPAGAPLQVAVDLVNSRGQTMRSLTALAPGSLDAVPQYDLPLAWLAPGEYGIAVSASSPGGSSKQLLRFRVIG